MKQPPLDPPPPPPDFPPPPSQSRQSRRTRAKRSSNERSSKSNDKAQQTTSSTTDKVETNTIQQQNAIQQQQQQQQQHVTEDSPAISTSAKTITHENTTHATIPPQDEETPTSALHTMEISQVSPADSSHYSRFPRLWSKHPFDVGGNDGIMMGASSGSSVEGLYYGDVMSSFPLEESSSIKPNYSTDSHMSSRFQRFRQTVSASLRSSFSKTPTSLNDDDDDDSLSDFQEWTPPDSAYGAAFPVCGWVPKHIRRLIEATIIGMFVFILVYFVVTTSIRLSLDKQNENDSNSGNSGKNNDNNMFSDDDHYITNDHYYYNNGDDEQVMADDDAVVDDDANDDNFKYNDDDGRGEEAANDDEQQDDDNDKQRLFARLF